MWLVITTPIAVVIAPSLGSGEKFLFLPNCNQRLAES
jgi:hypothetical protein